VEGWYIKLCHRDYLPSGRSPHIIIIIAGSISTVRRLPSHVRSNILVLVPINLYHEGRPFFKRKMEREEYLKIGD